jgi:hypothetical protein
MWWWYNTECLNVRAGGACCFQWAVNGLTQQRASSDAVFNIQGNSQVPPGFPTSAVQ